MPSRDDRIPLLCSERMKICQKQLSKVYNRSKSLLVTACADKVVPEGTRDAARGFTNDCKNPRKGDGLSKFEKEKLSPYLSAVAGLFEGQGLLKQFQLRQLQCSLAAKYCRTQSQSDCPQSCTDSTCQDPASVPSVFEGYPFPQPPTPPSWTCSDVESSASEVKLTTKAARRKWSEGDGCVEPTVSSDSSITESTHQDQGKASDGIHQNSWASTLNIGAESSLPVKQMDYDLQLQVGSTVPEERLPTKVMDFDQQLQLAVRSSKSLSLINYRNVDVGKSKILPNVPNTGSKRRSLSEFVVPQSSFPFYGQSSSKSSIYRTDDTRSRDCAPLLPGASLPQRGISTSSDSHPFQFQLLPSGSQQIPVSLHSRDPVELSVGTDSPQRTVPTMTGGNLVEVPLGTYTKRRDVSTVSFRCPPQLLPGSDLEAIGASATRCGNPSLPGSVTQQIAIPAVARKSLPQLLPGTQEKVVATTFGPQPDSFSFSQNKKSSRSSNVLQLSVANRLGTSGGPPKPLHNLSVSQLHDAICDHSTPDCPSFKKEKSGARHQIPQLQHSLQEHNCPQSDSLDHRGSTNPQIVNKSTASQEIMTSDEKCMQYAFEVRTDMKRQEKSSANLWKYGNMAVCTENPGRDYATGESPPDAWELMAKSKLNVTGIHWSKSGIRKVVNYVCQILKQNKWGKGIVNLLNAVKGNLTPHCVNSILQRQKDPHVCLAFFNWAKRQKGYRHDVFGFTTMINILGRARNLKGIRHLLEDMHRCGVEPTVATYNVLILCYGKLESLDESLRVFRIMQEAGCMPDNVTYSILIHFCIKSGYLNEALRLYQGMLEAGLQPDTITYSIVIDSLGKSGNLREARKLFHEMRERGYFPNEFTYNSMINRHAKARKTQHALKYYNEMRRAGFKLNAVTCTTMMGVLDSLGKFEEAERLFLEMQQAGIVADTAAYSLIINMWGNCGNLDKAVSWYGRMLGNLVTPSLSVFSSLIKAHLQSNLYEAAQHFLTSMSMWGINPDLKLYTILLRHCTDCEKQEHADAVLGIMDRLGYPAHRFLYELLTAKTQDIHATRSQVESYFDLLQQENQDSKRAFANALVDFLQKLQCKTDPQLVWEVAMAKGLYPSTIIRREAPNHWLVDLHSMSLATALVALPKLLVMLKDNWVQHPTKRVYIVTGWGKRSQVTGSSAMKQAVNDVLDSANSPFSPDHRNAGVFVSYGHPFRDWIAQPSIMKKLGIMAAESVVH